MTPARRSLFSAPQPDYAVPPGETLRMRLEELDMSQADLARRTSLTTKHVNQLVKGVVTLSPDVAQRLAYATNVPLDWWLRLEADYQAAKLRLADNATTSAADNWVKTMPVTALVRVGVLPASPRDNPSRLKQLLQFFGVANIDAYDAVWDRAAVAFRQSTAHTVSGGAVNSWLRLGELAAQTLDLPAFDPALFREALSHVGALSRRPIFEGIDAARSTFGSAGVGVLFIPEIAGARVYGASRWTTTGKNPLIQLSIRERTDDKMWLSLVHEAGHVLLHDRKLVFLEQDETHKTATAGAAGDVTEQEAERFAWQILLPGVGRDELADVHSVENVYEVADSVGVSASLVVCRLQSLGMWRFDQGNNLKHRVPAAAVGWRPPTTLIDRSTVRSARRADRRLPGAPS